MSSVRGLVEESVVPGLLYSTTVLIALPGLAVPKCVVQLSGCGIFFFGGSSSHRELAVCGDFLN
jgi:hypothetical protein